MRRLLASLMVVLMLVMCVQPCFAAEPDDSFAVNPRASMDLSVWARKSGDDNYQKEDLNLTDISSPTKVDYKIDLNMDSIKAVLNSAALRSDKSYVRNGKLAMNLEVTIAYPASAIISEESLKTTGVSNVYNGIFVETKRVVDNENKQVVSTFALNNPDLTLQNLIDSEDTYLKDITFELKDGVTYSTNGGHVVAVSASGSVNLTFTNGHKETVVLETEAPVTHSVNTTVQNRCIFVMVDAVAPTCDTAGHGVGVKCIYHEEHGGDAYHEEDNIDYAIGVMKPAVIPALDHMRNGVNGLVHVAAKSPSCTTTGERERYVCMYCKKNYSDADGATLMPDIVIPATGHHRVSVAAVDKTCTTDGHKAGEMCDRCGTIFSGMEVIPAGHTKLITTAARAATCTEDGCTEGAICSVCNTVISVSRTIPATGHKFGDWITNTETEKMTRTCSVCNYTETIDIHEHNTNGETVTVPATCTSKGSVTQKCTCGYVVSVTEIPKTAHTMTKHNASAATCMSEGNVEYYSCSVCNLNYRDEAGTAVLASVIIPKDSKNHANLTRTPRVVTAATCMKPGLKVVEECDCGYVKNEIIPQLVHTPADIGTTLERVELAAGCETTGIIAHLHCGVCGRDYSLDCEKDLTGKDFVIPAKGHSWVLDRTASPAIMRCEICNAVKELTSSDCPGHQYQRTIVSEATCTVDGMAKDVCMICGHTENVVLPAGHEYGMWIEPVLSTCTVKGSIGHYHCLKCNKYFDRDKNEISNITTEFLEHDLDDNGVCRYGCGYKVVVSNNANEKIELVGNAENAYVDDDEMKQREEDFRNALNEIGVTINYIVKDRFEVSDKIDEDIQKIVKDKNLDSDSGVEKIPFDINVEKVIEYVENTTSKKDITEIKETNDYIDIKVDISSIKNMTSYKVHRMHEGNIEYIEENANAFGEYISNIDRNNWKLTMHVKRFSEYVVVGYSDNVGQLNPETPGNVSGVGGGSSTFTVVFHANGGTVVESVKVKRGETVSEPTTTRDGYKFAGWFTDSALTKPYDFSTPVKSSLHLYAKWVEDGTAGDSICNKFTDINIAEWYHEGVHYAVENGMMNGTSDTTFEPNTNVSRAMLVTVLWRAENKPKAVEPSKFVDLVNGYYYVDAVNWANENGVVLGTTETTFEPNASITREQFAAIMYRYAKLKGFDVSVGENTNILSYTDFGKISEYAIPALQYAAGSGLMKGKTETTLNPTDNATRAEMATILFRFFSANK